MGKGRKSAAASARPPTGAITKSIEGCEAKKNDPLFSEEIIGFVAVKNDNGKMEIKETSTFNMSARYFMLTYKTHLNKEKYIQWFKDEIWGGKDVAFIRLAHENGKGDEITPYEHTHVLVDLGANRTWKDCGRKFDFCNEIDGEWIHPHINRYKTIKHFRNGRNYIAKEDPDNEDLKDDDMKGIIDDIMTLSIEEAAAKYGKDDKGKASLAKIYQVCSIKKILGSKEKEVEIKHEDIENPYPHQSELIKEMEYPANDRTIIGYIGERGCEGKSRVGRALATRGDKKWIYVNMLKDVSSSMLLLLLEIHKGWTGYGIFVNVSKGDKITKEFFGILENLKDKNLQTLKFMPQSLKLEKPPHIIVAMNFMPYTNSLSLDRWDLRIIQNNGHLYRYPAEDLEYHDLQGTRPTFGELRRLPKIGFLFKKAKTNKSIRDSYAQRRGYENHEHMVMTLETKKREKEFRSASAYAPRPKDIKIPSETEAPRRKPLPRKDVLSSIQKPVDTSGPE